MSLISGPVTLTTFGQVVVAQVVGFDQNGNPWTGPIPTPSWSIDNTSIASIAADATNPANEDVTAVANGTANLTASLTTAEGLALSDVEQVIVNIPIQPPPPPVLSSIKVQFNQ